MYAAEIDWVKSVTNELVVSDQPSWTSKLAETIDDAPTTTQVKSAPPSHKSTRALTTKVTTNAGTVVISGVAKSDVEKSLVTKLALDVRGTMSVTNNMTIEG